MKAELHLGDCIELMQGMQSASIDAVITDPPYSSGGMFRADRMKNTVEKYVQSSSIDTWRNSNPTLTIYSACITIAQTNH